MRYWIYKCNAKNERHQGDWDHVFNGNATQWGTMDELPDLAHLSPGDLIIAHQTDRNELVGLAKVVRFNRKGAVVLEPLDEIRAAVRPLKKANSNIAAIPALQQGNMRTIHEISKPDAERLIKAARRSANRPADDQSSARSKRRLPQSKKQDNETGSERAIWIYGNPDKSELGFPMPGDLSQYLSGDIFSKENGRYRYTQGKKADVIVLSRDCKLYGHFEIDDRVKPTAEDRAKFPAVKYVYLVCKSVLYGLPIPLAAFGITNIRFGHRLTEGQFQAIQEMAEPLQATLNPRFVPGSEVEQERLLCEIKQRLGQSEFRKTLMEVYNHRCAVTGCDAVAALEAAHIDPYISVNSNHPANGLLLRGDIHTLFDLDLMAIDPKTFVVGLAPSLLNSSYADLHERKIRLPERPTDHPDRDALATRWLRFTPTTDG